MSNAKIPACNQQRDLNNNDFVGFDELRNAVLHPIKTVRLPCVSVLFDSKKYCGKTTTLFGGEAHHGLIYEVLCAVHDQHSRQGVHFEATVRRVFGNDQQKVICSATDTSPKRLCGKIAKLQLSGYHHWIQVDCRKDDAVVAYLSFLRLTNGPCLKMDHGQLRNSFIKPKMLARQPFPRSSYEFTGSVFL
ncbi:hypothetical protein AAVH_31317, partial [Aphelenchoides avenae]